MPAAICGSGVAGHGGSGGLRRSRGGEERGRNRRASQIARGQCPPGAVTGELNMPIDLQPTPNGALVCALMAPSRELLEEAIAQLATSFGPARHNSQTYPFDYTDYYAEEMGADLVKGITWFGGLVGLSVLANAKRQTMALEREFAVPTVAGLNRRVNADPGLVTVDSLVLATTKYSGHRICIEAGIYAETTLLFRKGRYEPLPWSYLDYQNEWVQEFLQEIRRELLGKG